MGIGKINGLLAPAFIRNAHQPGRMAALRCSTPQAARFGKVTVILGKNRVILDIPAAELTIGRKPDNHIRIDIEKDRFTHATGHWVASHHLVLRRDAAGKIWIRDLSANGATLNETPFGGTEIEMPAQGGLLSFGGLPMLRQSPSGLPQIRIQSGGPGELTLEILPNNQYLPPWAFYRKRAWEIVRFRDQFLKPIGLVAISSVKTALLKRFWPF